MNKLNCFSYLLVFFITTSFLNTSCGDKGGDSLVDPPVIGVISPANGESGTVVTITGARFGNDKSKVKVLFNTTNADKIISVKDTEIKVEAPAGFPYGAVQVKVLVSGVESNAREFNYVDLTPQTPTIAEISPEGGEPGNVITITGSEFGNDRSKVKVLFDATEAENIISVTNTEIKVEAPADFSEQTVQVKVQVSGLESNTIDFHYATPAVLVSATPELVYKGVTVVITGSNFSTNKDENIVKFGNNEAEVIEATTTSLTVITPDAGNFPTTNITVTKSGAVSNVLSVNVDVDLNKVVAHAWTTTTIRDGVIYKTGSLSLFGEERTLHILDVTLNASNTLGIGFSGTAKSTVALCRDNNAIVGVNAGYFPLGTSSDKDPYIRINGETIQSGHLNVNPLFTNSALLINNNVAEVRKFTTGGRNQNQIAAAIPVSEAENIIVCGPMLITDGVLEEVNLNESHNTSLTGRTGFGVTADGKRVFMVVAEYRTTGATVPRGITTPQLAKILKALGSHNAMNFDGGGSSTMFVEGRGTDGRVSINGSSLRSVRSVVYVK